MKKSMPKRLPGYQWGNNSIEERIRNKWVVKRALNEQQE